VRCSLRSHASGSSPTPPPAKDGSMRFRSAPFRIHEVILRTAYVALRASLQKSPDADGPEIQQHLGEANGKTIRS
jgi:hypothetical protein